MASVYNIRKINIEKGGKNIALIIFMFLLSFTSFGLSQQNMLKCTNNYLLVSCLVDNCYSGVVIVNNSYEVYTISIDINSNSFNIQPKGSEIFFTVICQAPQKVEEYKYKINNVILSDTFQNVNNQLIVGRGCYSIRTEVSGSTSFLYLEKYRYSEGGCEESQKVQTLKIPLKSKDVIIHVNCKCIENKGLLLSIGDFASVNEVTLASSDEVVIYLKKGWNMISNPSDKPITLEDFRKSGCNIRSIWKYENKKWQRPTEISNDAKGYFVYATNDCVLRVKKPSKSNVILTNELSITLQKGWNLIRGIDGLTCEDLERLGCKLSSKSKNKCFWIYQNKKWVRTNVTEMLYGYWVYCREIVK
ncbi:MAG: hypothetical protein QW197_00415 [Candidatus Aenigmatarchaeota archaeon]